MTLTQLEAFALVARLGSVKAAAQVLGVSEPAVSQALAALRSHLGDPLVVRAGTAMELTPAGQRVVAIARQIVTLAVEAEAAVRQAQGAPELLRVVATSTIVESVAPALLQAFSARHGPVEVSVGAASGDEMPALLMERLADVALGPRLTGDATLPIETAPLMRYWLVFVTSPSHPLARARAVPLYTLPDQTWLLDPTAADPGSEVARLLRRLRVPAANERVFASQAAALAAAEAGEGLSPAVAHVVARHVDRGGLVRLPVEGLPIELLWHVNTLGSDRRPQAATRLRRFMATPEAMQAMQRADGSVPASRFRPPVYVTIWS